MISRVIAEFENPDLAEYAVRRVKESVEYVYSGSIMYDHTAENRHLLSHGTNYAVLPTAFNTHTNFLTAVLESPASKDAVPEPSRRRNTTAVIICGSGAVDNVISVMNAMGGLNIRSAV